MDIIRLITLQFNTGNELSGWGNDVLPVGVMWTASVELQIYLLFPLLLALALRPRGLRFLIEVCAFVLILRFIFLASLDSGWSDLYHTILGRLDQFVLGMILALFMSHKFSESRLKSWSLFLFALLSFLLLGQFRGIYRDFYTSTIGGSASFLVEGLIFAAIIYTYQSPSISIPKKISDALAWIGERSYSVYLFHLLVGRVIVGYLDQLGLWNGASLTRAFLVTIFVVLPGVLLFSALSYRIVEKPFIELGKLKKFSLLSYSKS
jgi:peptidoglycan/LPS O-acetylase OafA/YrhL